MKTENIIEGDLPRVIPLKNVSLKATTELKERLEGSGCTVRLGVNPKDREYFLVVDPVQIKVVK